MKRARRSSGTVAAICLAALVSPAVHSGGNIGDGWVPPHGFNNRYWDVRQQSIRWQLEMQLA